MLFRSLSPAAPPGARPAGTPSARPTPRVNRARHSIFGAPRASATPKADPERERKNRVKEHILANNPVAKARVTAMRGGTAAPSTTSVASFTKGGGTRSKFQAVAAAALSQASLGASPVATSITPAVVSGISEDAAATRSGVEELMTLVKGLASELKAVRSEMRALRRAGGATVPTPRGSQPSRSLGEEGDSDGATPILHRLPATPRRSGGGRRPSLRSRETAGVVAVDNADAVAFDALGGSSSSAVDAGTGGASSSTSRAAKEEAVVVSRLEALTDAITQRVAASVSAAMSIQLEERLAAAGLPQPSQDSKAS